MYRTQAFGTFEIGNLDLFRISCFEIRILELTIIRNLFDALRYVFLLTMRTWLPLEL